MKCSGATDITLGPKLDYPPNIGNAAGLDERNVADASTGLNIVDQPFFQTGLVTPRTAVRAVVHSPFDEFLNVLCDIIEFVAVGIG